MGTNRFLFYSSEMFRFYNLHFFFTTGRKAQSVYIYQKTNNNRASLFEKTPIMIMIIIIRLRENVLHNSIMSISPNNNDGKYPTEGER